VENNNSFIEYDYMNNDGKCYVCNNCGSFLTKVGYLKPFDSSGIPCVEYSEPKFCGYCGIKFE
jgi:hypothetical protein